METENTSPYDEYGNSIEAFPDQIEQWSASHPESKIVYVEDSVYRIKIENSDKSLTI